MGAGRGARGAGAGRSPLWGGTVRCLFAYADGEKKFFKILRFCIDNVLTLC